VTVEVRGVAYRNVLEAARAVGMSPTTMLKRIRSYKFPDYRSPNHAKDEPPAASEQPAPAPPAAPRYRWPASFEARAIGRPVEEPRAWDFDGDLLRRADVVDRNYDPPRVLRRVGWRRCMRCARPQFSQDVVAIRLCWNCGGLGSLPVGPKHDDSMLDIRQRCQEREPSDSRSARG
jgi:hypothetical protein